MSQSGEITLEAKLQAVSDYDEVPYPVATFPFTHPDRSAMIAKLFHLDVVSPDACRVLELGCAHGSNLIPMAVEMPNSEFVGIDLSEVQINEGRKIITQLGLENIRLEQWDILDLANSRREEVGKFDYIITHGIFSWVPDNVREAILRISKELLTPNGIAMISYNTKPGWSMRGMVRDMMLYHTRNVGTAKERATSVRSLVKFLATHSDERRAYGQFLRQEAKEMEAWEDAYLLHDSLEANNESFYFHEFMGQAGKYGLQYLGDCDTVTMFPMNLSDEAQKELANAGFDHGTLEQYMDYIRGRMFRQTLLVHSDRRINRALNTSDIKQFYFVSSLTIETPDLDILSNAPAQFKTPTGRFLNTEIPIVKACVKFLCQHAPLSFTFDQIFAGALHDIARVLLDERGVKFEPTEEELQAFNAQATDALFYAFVQGMIDVGYSPSRFRIVKEETPRASALARLQSFSSSTVTTLRHHRVILDNFAQTVLQMLDGTQDRSAITTEILRRLEAGVVELMKDGKPLRDHAEYERLISEEVDLQIDRLARVALFV